MKLEAVTPLTGSLKVSVNRSGFALLGDASVSVIEDSVGFVVSIVHVYGVAVVCRAVHRLHPEGV